MHLLTRSRIVAILLGVALGIHHTSVSAANPNEFVDFSAPNLPGRLYVPPEAQNSPRPVILFLHGAGEGGSNNTSQVGGNINNLFAAAKAQGAFLYAPQSTATSGILNWNNLARTTNVITKLDDILSTMNVDTDRVYLTGLSMGGGGAWSIASRNPDKFAALLPIAGVQVASDFDATNLIDIPTWAFHATDDPTVSRNKSRSVVNGILTAAGEPIMDILRSGLNSDATRYIEFEDVDLGLHYTEFRTGGHQIWGGVYGTPEVTDWMFSQSLAVPEPGAFFLLMCGVGFACSAPSRRKNR